MAKKLALLIASSAYQDRRFPALAKPGKDVAALEAVLTNGEIGAFQEVRSFIDKPCDFLRREIARLFAGRGPDDLLLLFFAGHGIKDDYGKLYLVTSDTDRDLLSATGIGADFITQAMDESRSRRQVLLLDCCHSGAVAQGVRAADATVGALEAFTGKGSGKVVITASDSYEYSWEGGETPAGFENSLFTHYLVEGLKSGKADVNGDGIVTLDELYKYVHARVLATTPKQTPQWKLADAAGDIEIARNPAPGAPLPEDLTQAVKSPLPYVREGVVHELKRLLLGSNPALAVTAREALEGLAADRDRRVQSAAAKVLEAARAGRLDADITGGLDSRPKLPVPAPPPPIPMPPPLVRPVPSPAPRPEPVWPVERVSPPPSPTPAPKRRRGTLLAAMVGVPVLLLAGVVGLSLMRKENSGSSAVDRGTPPESTVRPADAPPRPASFSFAPWPPGNGWATFELVVDGQSAGHLSNAGSTGHVEIARLEPGLHSIRLDDLALYRADGVQVSQGGWCQNIFLSFEGKTSFSVNLSVTWTGSFFQPVCQIQ